MKLKAMAMVMLAGLAGAAGGCGGGDSTDVNVAMSVRYATDGTLVVFAGSAIDTYGADLARKMHLPLSPLTPGQPYNRLFTLSDDGSVAAIGSSSGSDSVQLFDLPSGRAGTQIKLGQAFSGAYSAAPQGLVLSPAGDLLFAVAGVGQDDISGMFATSGGAALWTIEEAYGVTAAFAADESALYVHAPTHPGGGLLKIDSRTGTIGLDAALTDSVQGFGGMSDANTLIGVGISLDPVSYAESTEIDLLSTTDGSVTGKVSLPANTGFAGNEVLNPPAFHCAVAAGSCVMPVVKTDSDGSIVENAVQVWALDGTLLQNIDQVGGDVAISPDGQVVAVVMDGDVAVYRVSDGSELKLIPYRNQNAT
jgi:hypothetical protein